MNFAILGVGGYIAPRHLQAINDINGKIILACDVHDSVGILDRYGLNIPFVLGIENFQNEYLKISKTTKIDFVSICSPNQFHFEQIKWSLENGSNVICEKPLVLTTNEVDELIKIEIQTGKKVFTILQLREHESIKDLKNKIETESESKIYDLKLHYITSRGPWYQKSWKGNEELSGGLATNIGIHFFDMLVYLFGELKEIKIEQKFSDSVKGSLKLEKANVDWFLSINSDHLPESSKASNQTTFRQISINNEEIEFSQGFTDLHTICYKKIIDGLGHGPNVARTAIKIVEDIRNFDS